MNSNTEKLNISYESLVKMTGEEINSLVEKNLKEITFGTAVFLLQTLFIYSDKQKISNKVFEDLLFLINKKAKNIVSLRSEKDNLLLWYATSKWTADVKLEMILLNDSVYVSKNKCNYSVLEEQLKKITSSVIIERIIKMSERASVFLKIQNLKTESFKSEGKLHKL